MLGKLVVGEIAVGEVVTGEIMLGKLRWGNDLTPFVQFISVFFHLKHVPCKQILSVL